MKLKISKLEILREIEENPISDYLDIKLSLDEDKRGFHVHFKYGDAVIIKELLYTPSNENNLDVQVFYLMKMAFKAGVQQGKIKQKEEIQKAIGANIITKIEEDETNPL